MVDDPSQELARTTAWIDLSLSRIVDVHSFSDGVERVLEAILRINTEQSRAALARYATERKIRFPIRQTILNQLAQNKYEPFFPIAERILGSGSDEERKWLRDKASSEWGQYGRELLNRFDHVHQ